MDVLLLFEYPTLCGGEQSLLCLLPTLKRAGCRIRAAAPPEGPLAEALAQHDLERLPLVLHDALGVRRPLPACRAELAELLTRSRPALLHANSLSMARMSGPVVAQCGVAGVGHLRDIVRLSRQAVEDVNGHALLLAVSQAAANFHVAQGLDAGRMHVLYNGVDPDHFKPHARTGYLHRDLKLADDAKLLGTIGQIALRKGHDLLLSAARRVVGQRPDAHFLVIGQRLSRKAESQQFENDLHAMAAESPLAGHVHFLGWRTDVPQLLAELTLLVHPARQEPLGRVLLEAAASSCPIVATNVGGTAEIFTEPKRGASLVAPDDANGLAEAILSSLNHPGQNTPQVLATAEDAAQQLLRLWRHAIHGSPVPN